MLANFQQGKLVLPAESDHSTGIQAVQAAFCEVHCHFLRNKQSSCMDIVHTFTKYNSD